MSIFVADDAQLAAANESAPEGELIKLLPKRFTAPIAPRNRHVTYEASGATVPSLSVYRDFTRVIGATVEGTLTVQDCQGAELRALTILGGELAANRMLWLIRNASGILFSGIRSYANLGSASECRGRYFYSTSNSAIQDCVTVIEYVGPNNGEQFVHNVRDKSSGNTFERDTILAGLNSPKEWARMLMLATSGSYPATSPRNTYRDCHYACSGMIYLQDNVADWTLERSTFQSAVEFRTNRMDRVLIDRCQFHGGFIEDSGGRSTGSLKDCLFVGGFTSSSPFVKVANREVA